MKRISILVTTFLFMIFLISGTGLPLLSLQAQAATISRQYGDVNWDGQVDSRDAVLINQHNSASSVAKIKNAHPDWILTGDDFKVADVNCDGTVDSRDYMRVLEYNSAATIQKIRNSHPEWYNYLRRYYRYNTTLKLSTQKVNLDLNGIKTCKVSVTQNYGRPCYLKFVTIGTQLASFKLNGWDKAQKTYTITLGAAKTGSFSFRANLYDTKKNKLIVSSDVVAVNIKRTSVKTIVSKTEIDKAAKKYGISTSSNAYKALLSINTKYGSNSKVSNNKSGLLIFMFEGVGKSAKTGVHRNAMCVVAKNGVIKFISKDCTSIPDKPFSSSSHPTLTSGIYRVKAHNHTTKTGSNYAALKVYSYSWGNPKYIRFTNSRTKKFKITQNKTSINIHARWDYTISNNSEGCQLIGSPAFGKSKTNEYLKFCKAVGILKSSCKSMNNKTKCQNSNVKGIYILDRSFGRKYLTNVGYPSGTIPYLK